MNLAPKAVLVVGGARSGKTQFAQEVGEKLGKALWIVSADRNQADDELKDRLAALQERRSKNGHIHLEWPFEWEVFQETCAKFGPDCVVLDSMTLMVARELSQNIGRYNSAQLFRHLDAETDQWLKVLGASRIPLVIVSNETGEGVVPSSIPGRLFRDAMGLINQKLSASCQVVVEQKFGNSLLIRGGDLLFQGAKTEPEMVRRLEGSGALRDWFKLP